jgi:CoA:oxalate CoA-transferase
MQLTGLSRQLYFNETPKPVGNRHPLSYPVDSFPTTSGDIVLVCFSSALFAGLADLIGRPDMAEDPELQSHPGRSAREDEVRAAIANWTRTRSREDVLAALQAIGIPAAPILGLDEVVKSDHAISRRLVRTGTHTRFGAVPMVPQPVRFSECPERSELNTPSLGEQTEEVLHERLGLGAEKIKELRSRKVI